MYFKRPSCLLPGSSGGPASLRADAGALGQTRPGNGQERTGETGNRALWLRCERWRWDRSHFPTRLSDEGAEVSRGRHGESDTPHRRNHAAGKQNPGAGGETSQRGKVGRGEFPVVGTSLNGIECFWNDPKLQLLEFEPMPLCSAEHIHSSFPEKRTASRRLSGEWRGSWRSLTPRWTRKGASMSSREIRWIARFAYRISIGWEGKLKRRPAVQSSACWESSAEILKKWARKYGLFRHHLKWKIQSYSGQPVHPA